MTMLLLFSTFFILSTCIVSSVCELSCFVCNTLSDGYQCENNEALTGMSLFSRPCAGKNASYIVEYEKPLCRKIVQRIKTRNNLRIVKRSCGYELHQKKDEDLCYKYKTEDHEEIVCQCFGHLCNDAVVKSTNIFWNFTFSFLVLFWYFKLFLFIII